VGEQVRIVARDGSVHSLRLPAGIGAREAFDILTSEAEATDRFEPGEWLETESGRIRADSVERVELSDPKSERTVAVRQYGRKAGAIAVGGLLGGIPLHLANAAIDAALAAPAENEPSAIVREQAPEMARRTELRRRIFRLGEFGGREFDREKARASVESTVRWWDSEHKSGLASVEGHEHEIEAARARLDELERDLRRAPPVRGILGQEYPASIGAAEAILRIVPASFFSERSMILSLRMLLGDDVIAESPDLAIEVASLVLAAQVHEPRS
jgi:hypothetical protein